MRGPGKDSFDSTPDKNSTRNDGCWALSSSARAGPRVPAISTSASKRSNVWTEAANLASSEPTAAITSYPARLKILMRRLTRSGSSSTIRIFTVSPCHPPLRPWFSRYNIPPAPVRRQVSTGCIDRPWALIRQDSRHWNPTIKKTVKRSSPRTEGRVRRGSPSGAWRWTNGDWIGSPAARAG